MSQAIIQAQRVEKFYGQATRAIFLVTHNIEGAVLLADRIVVLGKNLPDEFFRDLLDEYFSPSEMERQLETALHWGRYAELFDHDSVASRFYIPQDAASEVSTAQ